jgi:hypothetical protein
MANLGLRVLPATLLAAACQSPGLPNLQDHGSTATLEVSAPAVDLAACVASEMDVGALERGNVVAPVTNARPTVGGGMELQSGMAAMPTILVWQGRFQPLSPSRTQLTLTVRDFVSPGLSGAGVRAEIDAALARCS